MDRINRGASADNELTAKVLNSYSKIENPRLRDLVSILIRHGSVDNTASVTVSSAGPPAPSSRSKKAKSESTLVLAASPGQYVGNPVTFTATLTGPGGVAIADQTTTFLIDGVVFSATINAKGNAHVSYALNAAGPYKVTTTCSSDANYNESSATFSITVVGKSEGRPACFSALC